MSDEDCILKTTKELEKERIILLSIEDEYLVDYIITGLENYTFPTPSNHEDDISYVIAYVYPDVGIFYSNFSVDYSKKCKNANDMVKKAVMSSIKIYEYVHSDINRDNNLTIPINYPHLRLNYNDAISLFELTLIYYDINSSEEKEEYIVLNKELTIIFVRLIIKSRLSFCNCNGEKITYSKDFWKVNI